MEKEKEVAVPQAIVPIEVGASDLQVVMEGEAAKRGLVRQYIAKHMQKGTDYGSISIGGRASKPSLFKPGSEKFLSLFRLTARFEKDVETWEMAGSEAGVFAFKCLLYASNGAVVGEGRGVAKLGERQGWTINNAVKIAQKRAQIDAVLRTGALSDFFTQDLEDMAAQIPKVKRADPTHGPGRYEDVDVVEDDGEVYEGNDDMSDEDKKEKIKKFLKMLGKPATPSAVMDATGIKLVSENYGAILEELESLIQK